MIKQVHQLELSTRPKRSLPDNDLADASFDNVLREVFMARMGEGGFSSSPDNNEKTTRVAPLITSLASEGAFLRKRFKQKHASVSETKQSNIPFPLHSEFFLPPSHYERLATATNTSPSQGPDDVLISHSLRSLTNALLIAGQATAPTMQMTMMMNRRKRRQLNMATRIRLVGQVLGQARVQEALSVVKEMKQYPALANDEFVVALESTPLDALKAMPWDDLLRGAEERLRSHQGATH
jgi:hypothetical protein